MKNRISTSYYVRFLFNILLSAILFLVIALSLIYYLLIYNKKLVSPLAPSIQLSILIEDNIVGLVLALVTGVIVFAITFMILERRRNKNIEDIFNAVKRISDGDLSKEIKIDSYDELSMMADNINKMQIKIKDLIENERNIEKQKNELVTNIAHDLRTPLTSILGYLQIVESNNNLSQEEKNKYIKIAYDKSVKLGDLIEELFSFTKMSYGKQTIKLENIDIVRLIYQLVQEMYPLFEKDEISYEINTNIQKLNINVDPKLIARLFENLINNAIKYGKEGKRIIIQIEQLNDKEVSISVINYGKIIPKESLDKLFDRFYRADESRNSEVSGTGLGLNIAKNIVDIHKGSIKVSSDKNGTIFKVILKTDLSLEDDNNIYEENYN